MRSVAPHFVSDDYNKNENAWIISKANSEYAIRVDAIPEFSRYAGGELVEQSLDFGTPQEIYIPGVAITPSSSIYTQFWENYMKDHCNVNSKIVRCKVHFPHPMSYDSLKKFYWFDGSVWRLNTITNYSLTTKDLVECEFIRVQDVNNFIE